MKRQLVSDRAREILRQDDECVLSMLKQTLHNIQTQYNPEQEEAERKAKEQQEIDVLKKMYL